jgi:phospholipid/cholesterol/gamma-HCH transport system substrate-binding protein
MKTRTQKIRLGIFIFMSIGLLFLMIFFFAANKLFQKSDIYYVSYRGISVSGLDVGSPVNYMGIEIGSVSDKFIDPEDINAIIIELALKPGTPIKKDAYADIVSMGITGLKTIEIRGGSNLAEYLGKGKYIKAGSSASQAITGKATIIAEKTEKVINNLQLFTDPANLNKFSDAAGNINLLAAQLNRTIHMIDSLIKENKTAINETVKTASIVVNNLSESSQTLKLSVGRINSIIQGDSLQQIVGNVNEISNKLKETDLKLFFRNLTEVADQTKQLIFKIDENLDVNSQELIESIRLLRVTLSNLEETSNKINTDPSILLRGSKDINIPDKRLKNR